MGRLRYIRLTGRQKAVIWVSIILILLLAVAAVLVVRIRPIVTRLTESRTTNRVNRIVADAVSDAVASGQVDCTSLILFEKDSSGQVTALRSNMTEFNRLQTVVLDQVLARISEVSTRELSIPIGSLTGTALLAGRGPRITVRMQSVGSSTANLRNEFTSSGINQTRHQIIMDVDVRVSVLLPGCVTSVPVSQSFSVAETVLVGAVPENYTYFSAREDLTSTAEDYIMNNA